jgi:hypothetical protein
MPSVWHDLARLMRVRVLVILLLGAFAAGAVGYGVVERAAAAATKKKKKKTKKSTKSEEPEIAQPKAKPKPKWHADGPALAGMRAAGYETPKAIGWEDRAKGRAPLVVAQATTGADHHRVVIVGAPAYGAGTKPSVAAIAGDAGDDLQIDEAAELDAEVTPLSDPGFVHVEVTLRWSADGWTRARVVHAFVRAAAGSTEIACRVDGDLEDGTAAAAGKARRVRVREMHGKTPPTIEAESEAWGLSDDSEHVLSIKRYELPSSGLCRPLEVDAASLPHGTITIASLTAVKGKRELDPVKKAITARALPRISRCYDEALRDQPTLAGTLVARMTVSRGGTVSSVTIAKDDTSYGGWPCVIDALSGLYLPSAGEEDEESTGDAGVAKQQPVGETQIEITLSMAPPK